MTVFGDPALGTVAMRRALTGSYDSILLRNNGFEVRKKHCWVYKRRR